LSSVVVLAPSPTVGTDVRSPLQIGAWHVDPTTHAVSRPGDTRRVEPKAMQVLVLLAQSPGRVVTREQLFTGVWPGVVVGDEALTQCIIKLRRALDDDPRAPSYIETIPKRGYRLIAPVRPAGFGAPQEGGDGTAAPRSNRRLWFLASAALVALALVAFVALRPERSSPVDDTADDRTAPSISVAVLPFDSLNDAPDQAYFARGIGDDLATDLARLPGLSVIRATTLQRTVPEQRARYLVSGSVQRAAGNVRVNIHLIDGLTNAQLWSERFERPYADLFAVQQEMIARLLDLLPAKIGAAERERLAKRHTRNLEAYDAFLQAQALFLVRQLDRNEEARALYRKALALDPKFARAYAGLAMTYAIEHVLRRSGSTSAALERAAELAETAGLIDPDLPEVHWALGFVHVQSRRHDEAIESLLKATELNRSFADAYALLGGVHTYVGQPAKSIPLVRRAMRLNPDGGYLYFLVLGRAYLFEGDNEQALINLHEAAARNPANLETRIFIAATHEAAGNRLAANWEAEEIRSLEPDFALQSWLDTYPLTSPRLRARLGELLASAGV
jgi:DNA-binding winged helix-turn-helix (wHTH) protein/TolB-like protein/Flp pilus assembly protein TadD